MLPVRMMTMMRRIPPLFGARMASSLSYNHMSTDQLLNLDSRFGAQIYHPLPVVFSKAKGAEVWDPEGKKYLDFLSAYSAVNQGHCHPRLLAALHAQSERATLPSRAFQNDVWPVFADKLHSLFSYDRVLPMNTGAEGVETAVKLARRWAYDVKKVPANEAIILCAVDCFHGRTILCISLSSDPDAFGGFGPYVPGIQKIPYNDLASLEKVLQEKGKNIAAFLVEPIQGEAGIIVPDDGYLAGAHALCKKHNVLLIADEIQTGLGRTGKMLCHQWDNIRPDMVILGKALSGGIVPVSVVLADNHIMECIKPGQHGSTYGGNPLGAAVAIAALDVLVDENLCERANILGKRFRDGISSLRAPCVGAIRGRGLLNAVDIDHSQGRTAWEICEQLKDNGLLAKPTHEKSIRFAPPLILTDKQMDEALDIISKTLKQ